MIACKPRRDISERRRFLSPTRVERPRKRPFVTIGIGFRCDDGIVMCADTQITWPESHKYYECKVYEHRTEAWTMVNTFSGDPEMAKVFNEKFDAAMALVGGPYVGQKIHDVIETVLGFFEGSNSFNMLCAVVIPNAEMRLFRTTGNLVREVDQYDYIGAGDSSLLRYLGSLLTECLGREFGSEYAYHLGCYFVLKAKVFIDGCGGDTTAIIVRPHGNIEVRNGDTYNTEQKFMWLEKSFRMAAAASFDCRVPDRNVDDLLGKMVEKLKQTHGEMKIRIPWNPKDHR